MGAFANAMAESTNLAVGYAERLLKGVAPSQFARVPVVNGQVIETNHACFLLGHLSLYGCRVVAFCGQDSASVMPTEAYTKLFEPAAKCVDDPDGTIYPPMAEVTERFFASYRAAMAALRQVDDAVLDRENPLERMRERFPTLAGMCAFLSGGHILMHLGQMSAWRRAMGLGPA